MVKKKFIFATNPHYPVLCKHNINDIFSLEKVAKSTEN
jgi:hypothetical protein